MRAFVALDVDSDVRESVSELVRELRPIAPRARFVPSQNLHMTLRFLGETTKERLDTLASALSRSTASLPGFSLAFRGLGVFPSSRRARVLWVGTSRTPGELESLQSAVEKATRAEGFEPELGVFHPHLTVARFREPPAEIASVVESAEGRDFGPTTVRGLVLYESVMSPRGASYSVLQRFPLEAKGTS
jgi:RNA 2',3'-cyclic 3'-phosphodiesterase